MPARYSREEAAIQVLRMSKKPMSPTEIVQVGAPNGFFESVSRFIVASVNTSLYVGAKRPSPRVVSLGDGRYGLPEWGLTPRTTLAQVSEQTAPHRMSQYPDLNRIQESYQEPESAAPHRRGRPPRVDNNLAQRVAERMKEIEGCVQGLAYLHPDRVCLLIEFCHVLELHQEAVDLYQRLPKEDVDIAWMRRIEALVRVSRQRLPQ